MKPISYINIIDIVLCLIICISATAKANSSQSYDLDACIQIAFNSSWSVKQKMEAISAKKYKKGKQSLIFCRESQHRIVIRGWVV
jgi:hypothetical protein